MLFRSIELDATFAPAYINRSAARMHAGDLPGALADAELACGLRSTSWAAALARGLALEAGGRCEESRAALDRVVELAPARMEGYYYRARVRHRLGDVTGALSDLEHLLLIAPKDWPLRAKVEEDVEKLRQK